MFQRAFYAGVQCVEPVQRERFRRSEAAARGGFRAVMAEDAVQERDPPALVEAPEPRREELLPEHEVAEQPPLVRHADLRAVAELARLAEVVDERGADEQVAVQPGVKLARLERQR